MPKSKSLALLVCGNLTGALYATHGSYHRIFSEFLQNSLTDDTKFTLDPYDVVQNMEYPSDDVVDKYDAILLTGSAASAYENVDWINKLVDYVAHIARTKPHIKLIGICYGHQIISRALGSECVPNGGRWEVGPTPVDLTDIGAKIFGVKSLNIQQMHRDHVPTVPEGCHLLGSTPLSYNQGIVRFAKGSTVENPNIADSDFSLSDIQIFTTQGHPEFTEPIVTGVVAQRAASGVIDQQAAEDAERRRFWQNDGVEVIGKAIWGVLGVTP